MTSRTAIESSIIDEEATLDQVARLLERGAALGTWPEQPRRALALALAVDEDARGPAAWQVLTLRRHLFGAAGVAPRLAVPPTPSPLDLRRAERLRADLAARVRFRAGTYLA